jgi:hypothetical protein
MRTGFRTNLRTASGALALAFGLSFGLDAAATTLDAGAAGIDLTSLQSVVLTPWPGSDADFRAAMAAVSWNALASFASLRDQTLPLPSVPLNQDPLDAGCSFRNPAGCSALDGFGLRAGGNGQFGRRDLGPFLPGVRIVPIDLHAANEQLFALVRGSCVRFDGGDVHPCPSLGQGRPLPGTPEPTAALLFAAGVGVAALAIRRRC